MIHNLQNQPLSPSLYWEKCRSSLFVRTAICFSIIILSYAVASALTIYSIYQESWVMLGIAITTLLLLTLSALVLILPVKNKMFGTSLSREISEDFLMLEAQPN